MNKKGFTLVELLAVIVILGLLGALTIPLVEKIIKDNREKVHQVNVDTILNAAYDYAQTNPDYLPDPVDGDEGTTILLQQLYASGLLKDDMVNPNTDSKYNENCEIIITYYAAAPASMPKYSKFYGNYLFRFVNKD